MLDVGRSLFAEKGYEATSIEEIAARAGVSKPVVYEHFGGKEGLYAVVVDREMEALLSRITSALTGGHARELVEQAALALLLNNCARHRRAADLQHRPGGEHPVGELLAPHEGGLERQVQMERPLHLVDGIVLVAAGTGLVLYAKEKAEVDRKQEEKQRKAEEEKLKAPPTNP